MRPRRKTAWSFLEKLNTEVSYDPAIPFLNLGAEKITTQNDTCTLIFRAALFTIAQTKPTKMTTDTYEDIIHLYTQILLSHKTE